MIRDTRTFSMWESQYKCSGTCSASRITRNAEGNSSQLTLHGTDYQRDTQDN
jgi:hypothetical protein